MRNPNHFYQQQVSLIIVPYIFITYGEDKDLPATNTDRI